MRRAALAAFTTALVFAAPNPSPADHAPARDHDARSKLDAEG